MNSPTTKQPAFEGQSAHQLEDFLSSSDDSDSGTDDDDSFAYDEDNDEAVVAEEKEVFEDKNKRGRMLGMFKGMVKQASQRSLFSSSSGYQQELDSDYSDSDNDDECDKVPCLQQKAAPGRRGLLSSTRGSNHGTESDIKKVPKRQGLLRASSVRGLFNGGDASKPQSQDQNERPTPAKMPGLLKARSMMNVLKGGDNLKNEPGSENNSSDDDDDNDHRKTSLSTDRPGLELKPPSFSGPMESKAGGKGPGNLCVDGNFGKTTKTASSRVPRRQSYSGGNDGELQAHRPSNIEKRDELGWRSLHTSSRRDTSEELRSRSSHLHSRNASKDSLESRSMHMPSRRSSHSGSSRNLSKDSLESRSSHIPRRSYSRNKSSPTEVKAMASALLDSKNTTNMNAKRSTTSTGRRSIRRQVTRSKSDQADLLSMRASRNESSFESSTESEREQDASSFRQPHRQMASSSERRTDKQRSRKGMSHCDNASVSTHLSDLSGDFGDLASVPEQDLIDSPQQGQHSTIGGGVPFSVSCYPEKDADYCASQCTSPTAHHPSEVSSHGAVRQEKIRTRSMSSRRSARRTRSSSLSHERENSAVDLVVMPSHWVNHTNDDVGASRPSHSRRRNEEKARGVNASCAFQIDPHHPLVRNKENDSAEFVELNISCHDGESIVGLASVTA